MKYVVKITVFDDAEKMIKKYKKEAGTLEVEPYESI